MTRGASLFVSVSVCCARALAVSVGAAQEQERKKDQWMAVGCCSCSPARKTDNVANTLEIVTAIFILCRCETFAKVLKMASFR